MSRNTKLGSVLWFSVVLLATACGSEGPGSGQADTGPVLLGDTGADGFTTDADAAPDVPSETTCTVNADCRGGEICREGVCRVACSSEIPCRDPSLVCDESRGVCVGCVTVSDCNELTELCVDNTCVPACTSDASCPPDQVCGDDGACFVPECTVDENCPGGSQCVDRECRPIVPTICIADSTRCEDGALVQCSDDGTEETVIPCDDSVCVTVSATVAECRQPICTPGEVTCIDDRTAGLCDDTLTAFEPLRCREDQYCEAGACVAQVCVPEEVECVGNALSSCDGRGATATLTPCDETAACADTTNGCACEDAACVARVCTPGRNRCVGNSTQACSESGTSYLDPVACGSNQFCQAGTCVPTSCTAGSTQCTGDTLLTCQADGRTRRETNCATSGQICVTAGGSSSCGAPVCVPDSVACSDDGRSRRVCDARGANEQEIACPSSQFCVDGTCVVLTCDPRTCDEVDEAGEERIDTDDDGRPDCREGLEPGPSGVPACLDPDQDNDGLLDGEEGTCLLQDAALTADSDSDGWDDLVEEVVGTSSCSLFSSPASLADRLVVVDSDRVTFEVPLTITGPPADIVLMLDTTGSMDQELVTLRTDFPFGIVDPLGRQFPDLGWALTQYKDFPCPAPSGGTAPGNFGDIPFTLMRRVTTDATSVTTALTNLSVSGGGDAPEATWEALYQIATGDGVTGCGATVPAFLASRDRIAGVADGPLPGVGFREGSIPVIVHITDALAQNPANYTGSFAATRSEAITALRSLNRARYVAVTTNGSADNTGLEAQLGAIASELDSLVEPCAWGSTGRLSSCATTQCCTGLMGAGVAPVGGLCSPVTDLNNSTGSGVGVAVAPLVRGVLRGLSHDGTLSVSTSDDTVELASLVTDLTSVGAAAGNSLCGLPEVVDGGWTDMYPGTIVTAGLELNPASMTRRSFLTVEVELRDDQEALLGTTSVLVVRR